MRRSATESDERTAKARSARAPEPQNTEDAGAVEVSGAASPEQLLRLQRAAGNYAVAQLLAASRGSPATLMRAPATADNQTAPTKPFELGGLTIGTYAEAAVALRFWCSQ